MNRRNYSRVQFKSALAHHLRANPSFAERQLWAMLRVKAVGVRFRRQQTIGPFIADFFCPSAKLVVELDGDQHGADATVRYDAERTAWLQQRGFLVLRFSNHEFLKNKAAALETIFRTVEAGLPPPRTAVGGSTLPPGEGEYEGAARD